MKLPAAHALHVRLARLLRRRLRTTDEAGWLDLDRIGVVLPATPPRGALGKWPTTCAASSRPGTSRFARCIAIRPIRRKLDQSASQSRHELDDEGLPVEALELLFMQGMPTWKRALDFAGATVGLVMLAPVFLLIAGASKLTSPGPIFFGQWRQRAWRSTVCDVQVPLDDRRRRIAEGRLAGAERARRPGLQAERRSAA